MPLPLTVEKLAQGMTPQGYIDQIKVNKQPFIEIHDAVRVPADTLAWFDNLPRPLRLAVFTADWCGDALSTTPAILRLAETTKNLKPAVFSRDDELELTNSFLPEHRAGTVPVFVVLDEGMREVARFIETAKELVPAIDEMEEAIAQAVAATPSDNPRAVSRGRRTAYRVGKAAQWGEVILRAFQRAVAEGLALPPERRPAQGGTEWPPQQ